MSLFLPRNCRGGHSTGVGRLNSSTFFEALMAAILNFITHFEFSPTPAAILNFCLSVLLDDVIEKVLRPKTFFQKIIF